MLLLKGYYQSSIEQNKCIICPAGYFRITNLSSN